MENLKVNHVYLAKHLPVRKGGMSLFATTIVDKGKEIERVIVKEITDTCYLLSYESQGAPFYVEKADPEILYLEDLGIVAKSTK